MEHRWHLRVPIAIPVGLHFNDGACGSGLALNLSEGGLFIRTSMRPWRNGCVDVRMSVHCDDGDCSIRLPALVVHRTSNGIGVMFRELDEQAAAIVMQLLNQRPSSPRRVAPAAQPRPAISGMR